MAGNYPDVPGHRLAWHLDGTQWRQYGDTSFSTVGGDLVASYGANTNDETLADAYQMWGAPQGWLFPRLMDITHIYCNWRTSYTTAQWSADTTNLVDGTWNNFTKSGLRTTDRTTMRSLTHIDPVNLLGIRAFRLHNAPHDAIRNLHLYGAPASGESPDRLDIWDPTLDQKGDPALFDWDDITQGAVDTKQFRVKNLSPTFTAEGIVLAQDQGSTVEFSPDDTTYTTTLNIGDLGPGVTSSVLYARRTVAGGATLGLAWHRFSATPTSWA